MDTFLFTGHDSTTAGITWTLVCLARHPELQDKVRAEVKAVLGDRHDVTWDDLGQLTFTGQCVKEAMRLYPIVPKLSRILTAEVTMDGHVIPARTRVILDILGLHQNPHVWEDPTEYKPERFCPDKMVKMDPYQYIPFSAGPRNCIGQNFGFNEMKAAIAHIVSSFRFTPDPTRPVERLQRIVMNAETGAWLKAEPLL